MVNHPELDERLIRPILHAADRDSQDQGSEDHPDEETLALFAQGMLTASERAGLVRHLADCLECRRTASLVLTLGESIATQERRWRSFSLHQGWRSWAPIAAAASILLAVGWLFLARDATSSL